MRQHIFALVGGIISLCLLVSVVVAQGVRAVVVNEFANIRITPAIGAEVLGSVSAGFEFSIVTARSGDREWIRVIFNGEEGWVNLAPLVVLAGDVDALPVADPRSIPYGGFEAPRSGPSDQLGPVSAAATDGLRLRAGPSRAYPTLANINFNQAFTITGRTASNTWYQVNFEGLLGWVSSRFVRILSGDPNAVPVDGIVAREAPRTGSGEDDFLAVLRAMRDRIEIARASLDTIRAYWTDSALTGRAACRPYPARPSDFPIAVPLLAANYLVLEPLQADFNIAMANLRLAIDLFIEVCNQPGTGNPVGQATVRGALEIVNLVEEQFGDLQNRLNRLIPSDEIGPNQCVLRYNNRQEILPVINIGTIYLDTFTPRNYTTGYCIDALEGQVFLLQALPVPPGNLSIFLAISRLDDPANFLAVGRALARQPINLGPITIPRTGRYVILIADLGDAARPGGPQGDFAIRIADGTFNINVGNLVFDEETGSIIISSTIPEGVGQQGGTEGQDQPNIEQPTTVCPSLSFTCNQLFTCDEALACLAAGNLSLDPDSDGVPCEENLCSPTNP